MSLNELTDNIIQIARNNNVAESDKLSRYQVLLWIRYYRAMLIKRDLDRGYDLDSAYTLTLYPIHLDKISTDYGKTVYVGDKTLPEVINAHYSKGIINVKDMFGNIIQIGDYTKAKYQKYRAATCKDYIAWVKDNKLFVEGDSNRLEYVSVELIAEDPTLLNDCFDPDGEYPMPQSKIPELVQMILSNELRATIAMPSDTTNDSLDDTLNRVGLRTNRRNQ